MRLHLDGSGSIEVYYAPFEYINPLARIVLVGITPGPTQLTNAIDELRRQLADKADLETAMREAKRVGSFSGDVFRDNVTSQLDHWGIDEWLGLSEGSRLLFEPSHNHLIQTTSLLRYPVFVDGDPYNGSPNMLGRNAKSRYLNTWLLDHFARELDAYSHAMFFGLGPKVWRVLAQLVRQRKIAPDRVWNGLFHGSPNNTYRVPWLVGTRETPAPYKTNPEAYDQGRARFRNTMGLR